MGALLAFRHHTAHALRRVCGVDLGRHQDRPPDGAGAQFRQRDTQDRIPEAHIRRQPQRQRAAEQPRVEGVGLRVALPAADPALDRHHHPVGLYGHRLTLHDGLVHRLQRPGVWRHGGIGVVCSAPGGRQMAAHVRHACRPSRDIHAARAAPPLVLAQVGADRDTESRGSPCGGRGSDYVVLCVAGMLTRSPRARPRDGTWAVPR